MKTIMMVIMMQIIEIAITTGTIYDGTIRSLCCTCIFNITHGCCSPSIVIGNVVILISDPDVMGGDV